LRTKIDQAAAKHAGMMIESSVINAPDIINTITDRFGNLS